ncbi:uncharacterized protein G2W53_017504 [Senna tora]|uniref:Uncharacterized protein n=1 Tax=Senna tora TaxID=362788 RepID=A0A834WK92_9FABA|nr:uncharacterized protein G2W53_017504 [Senna tora]
MWVKQDGEDAWTEPAEARRAEKK